MHAGDDNEPIADDAVVEAVGEVVQQDPPGISMEDGIGVRVFDDGLHRLLHGAEEVLSQARPLCLIPLVSRLDAGRSSGPNPTCFTAYDREADA